MRRRQCTDRRAWALVWLGISIGPLHSSLRLDSPYILKISSRPHICLDCKQCMVVRFLPKTFLGGKRRTRSVPRPGCLCQSQLDISNSLHHYHWRICRGRIGRIRLGFWLQPWFQFPPSSWCTKRSLRWLKTCREHRPDKCQRTWHQFWWKRYLAGTLYTSFGQSRSRSQVYTKRMHGLPSEKTKCLADTPCRLR